MGGIHSSSLSGRASNSAWVNDFGSFVGRCDGFTETQFAKLGAWKA